MTSGSAAAATEASVRQIGILLFDGVEELDAVGPWEVDAPVAAPCEVLPVAPPAVFAAGLAGTDFAGVFLSSDAALAVPTAPSSPARTNATEPCLTVLQKSRIVIPVPHSCSRPRFQFECANASFHVAYFSVGKGHLHILVVENFLRS